MLRLALGALYLTTLGGCLASQSGGAILPSRYDVGAATTQHGEAATHYGFGLSWASVWPTPTMPIDVGLGYVIEAPNEPSDASARTDTPKPALYGPYLELAYRLAGTRHQRTWLALRGEWLQIPVGTDHVDGMGYTARAAWEVFGAGKGAGYCGSGGVGVFAEASLRQIPGDRFTSVLIAGATLRLPAVAFK
jgi:hypothetical protein